MRHTSRRLSARLRAIVPGALFTSVVIFASAVVSPALALHTNGAAAPMAEVPAVVGMVRDSAGQPVANAQVIVAQLNRVTSTDAAGAFQLRGLPAGAYHLTAVLIGYAPGHADVAVPESGPDVRVTITLRRAAIELSTVQVTATPTGADPRTVAQSTTEISGQALSRNLGATVAQTLANEPGVSLRFNGPAATAPVIRGLQGERILVLQDGDRAGDLSSSAPDHGVTVDPLTAQRIEVVRGPASLLYGNNALGGVVNVISNDIPTEIPSHVEGFLGGQAESASPGGTAAGGVTIPVGGSLALVGRAGARRVEDYRQGGADRLDNTYFRNYYGVGGLGFGTSRATGGVVYRGYGFDYGLPSAENEGAHIEGHRQELSGRSDIATGRSAVGSVRVGGTAQWYTHDELAPSGAVNTSFKLKTQTADALARTRLGALSGALGISGLFKQYASTGEEALTPAANSVGLGAFFFQEIPLRTVADPDALVPRLQLGGRFDRYRIESQAGDEKFGSPRTIAFNNVSGSVGLSIPVGTAASLAVSAARAFRAPSVEELFSNAFHEATGTFDRGNPLLKQEINQGIDGILRVHSGRVSGQIGGYWSRIDDFIAPDIAKDTTVDGEDGPRTVPLNQFSQADATLNGLEGRLEAEVAPRVVLGAMGDLVRGQFRATKEALPFMPPARVGGLARWDNGTLSFGGEVRYAFAQNRVPPAVSEEDPSGIATDAYTLVNVSAGYNLTLGARVNSIAVRIDNLTDEQYRDAASRIKGFAYNPGRNISLVYKVLF
jgi:iron complex outermembrane receptor protein